MSGEASSDPRKTIAVVLKCCVELVATAVPESMICRIWSLLPMSMVTMDTRYARIDFMPAVSHHLGEHPLSAAPTVFSQEQTECTRVRVQGLFKGKPFRS